jgi:methylated-DNA-[protein]-cysteine S-methyltransferase
MTLPYTAQARWVSPLGPVTLATTARGLAGLWFDAQRHHPGVLATPIDEGHAVIRQSIDELAAYFSGRLTSFTVPLDLQGTPFQQAVWRALCGIGAGATCSYAQIAQGVGRPAASRAAGAAIGRNPVSVIVPCHRVVGHDGRLTGYAAGLDRKAALLQLERAASCR